MFFKMDCRDVILASSGEKYVPHMDPRGCILASGGEIQVCSSNGPMGVYTSFRWEGGGEILSLEGDCFRRERK